MTQIYVFSILVLIVIGFAYFFYLRDKFQKAVVGHVWASFITKTHARVDALCKVSGNIVIPPPNLFSDNPGGEDYLVRGDKTANFRYPPLFPRALQATVRSVVYGEGNPEPFDPEKNPPILSAKLIRNLRNEASTALIMKGITESLRGEDIMKALETAGGGNKTLMYISIGIIIGLVALGFFAFQLSGQVGDLLALYGL